MSSAMDDTNLTMQLMMLLAYLPVITALAVMGLWALLRLHQRPRAGWIVLWIVGLTGIQLGGVSLLVSQFSLAASLFGGVAVMILNVALLGGHYVLEIAMWWLVLLGLFGPDSFRLRSSPSEPSSGTECPPVRESVA